MKKLLTITIIFLPAFLFAQQKTGNFIKDHLYIKVAPTIYMVGSKAYYNDEEGTRPAIYGAVGAKIRWAALGFSIGHLKFRKVGLTPRGVDLTITDFKRKKAFPVITAQWHKVHYSIVYDLPGAGVHYNDESGKDMYTIGAGMAFPLLKKIKVMATLGISRLNYSGTSTFSIFSRFGGTSTNTNDYKDHLNMPFIAASFVL